MPGIGNRREHLTDYPVLFWTVGAYLIIYRTTQSQHVEIVGNARIARHPVISTARSALKTDRRGLTHAVAGTSLPGFVDDNILYRLVKGALPEQRLSLWQIIWVELCTLFGAADLRQTKA